MRNLFIPFSVMLSVSLFAAGPEPAPLADALWRGHMELKVNGQLRNHFISNRMGDFGPTGFLQEKSKMNLDFTLIVNFLLNNVGEVSKAASISFKADQLSNLEENFKFPEEVMLEGGIKATQEISQKEVKTTLVNFDEPESDIQLPNGFLQILPSGRIDKKGSITIEGNMVFDYQGSGSYDLVKERKPASAEFAVLQEKANITRTYSLPLRFSMKMEFRKKALEASTPVILDAANPFDKGEREGKDTFINDLVTSCKVTLEPLFD